jgi:hypothetical protein
MGFLQMATASVGSFVVALLPVANALGLIVVFGGFVALALAAAIYATTCLSRDEQSALPGAAARTAEGN